MTDQSELWRVSTPEGIFEANIETLKQWISEGCVIPTDKVSKGNLNWIEAGRVPQLKGVFSGEITPVVVTKPVSPSFENFSASNFTSSTTAQTRVEPPTVSTAPIAAACKNHPEAKPEYVCRMCGEHFCRQCTKFVRGSVPVCPSCGDLCHEYRVLREKAARDELQGSGFGIGDFGRAIGYPLQHKYALLGGALIYGLLLLGGFRLSALGWMIMFACISQVISEVAWGRFNRSFMPDLSSSSFWEDRFTFVSLGLGITIISWGPLIVLVFALIFGVISGGGVPASLLVGGSHAAAESPGPDVSVLMDPEADPAKLAEENRKLQELRPGAQMAREAEASKAEASEPAGFMMNLMPLLGAGAFIAFLLVLFIAWGVFYYPMALTVAGYTQSFTAVINPLVGLDTIRRMGATYFKAFAMVMAVQVVSFVISMIIYLMTSAFALPFIGDLVGNFVNATFTFYFNLVIACILGLSLFKCADRLDIAVE